MRKLVLAGVVCAVALAAFSGEAQAFEGGGRSPSGASLIEWGQHYSGQLNNHEEDANYSGFREVAFYKLPPVSTRDLVTVNWHELPFTHNSSFPVCMILAQGIDDYSWGSVLHSTVEGHSCNPSGPAIWAPSGSGTASTAITVQTTDSASTYLEFLSEASQENPSGFETFPYDFTVEAPRHALTLTFPAVPSVSTNGVLQASVTGATGLPGPDGLVYTLTANWEHNGVWIGTGTSVGGQIAFPLSLPESAINERVRFIVSRPPDAQFQAVESPAIRAKVTAPVAPAPSAACVGDTARAHALARQHRRLQSRSDRVRGRAKRRLRHRVRHLGHLWQQARAEMKTACG